jgi:hypothetical protein
MKNTTLSNPITNKTVRAPRTKKWIDSEGREVPAKYVSAYDKARDYTARRILDRFERCRELLETCYAASMQDIEDLERFAGREEVALGGAKGNLQFTDFSGCIRVSREARYEIQFDERLQAARDIICRLVEAKALGIDADLAEIVKGVFAPNSAGLLSASRVLGLLRYSVRDADWLRAMDLIRASIKSQRGKTLLSCAERATADSEWSPILLDLAKCAGLYRSEKEGGAE